jgi:pilus assembly protein CpaC
MMFPGQSGIVGGLRRAVLLALATTRFLGAAPASAPASVDPALLQIAIEVVEVDETKTRKLGVEWFNTMRVMETPGTAPSFFEFGMFNRNIVYADLQALLSEGVADLLANPKLVTRNGTEANFHAGGELPYVTAASLGTTEVLFKQYGVKLKIKPTLQTGTKINILVDAEVSAPDIQRAVSLSGNTVPGILSRKVQTDLTMEAGTTLTLAGMIQNEKQWNRQGVPGLSRIPFLGYLFSRKIEETRRTSIVIFITPTILEGAPPAPSKPIAAPLAPAPVTPAPPVQRLPPSFKPSAAAPIVGEAGRLQGIDYGLPLDELLGLTPSAGDPRAF